jgi:hypothetical protein
MILLYPQQERGHGLRLGINLAKPKLRPPTPTLSDMKVHKPTPVRRLSDLAQLRCRVPKRLFPQLNWTCRSEVSLPGK